MTIFAMLHADRDPAHYAHGAYLFPHQLFTSAQPQGPDEAFRVVQHFDDPMGGVELTAMGGVFVRIPLDLPRTEVGPIDRALWARRQRFRLLAADRMNAVVCELALRGLPTAPISPLYVLPSAIIDAHASIQQGGGRGPIDMERQLLGPLRAALEHKWDGWRVLTDVGVLLTAAPLRLSASLSAAAQSLPTLVASAYWHYVCSEVAQAHAISSIITEQIIASVWRKHLATTKGSQRDRLADSRTYSLNVRLEVLLTVGTLGRTLYDAVHEANRPRNSLVHEAVVDLTGCAASMAAMQGCISMLCGERVAAVNPSGAITG